MILVLYSDSSYCQFNRIAACAYIVLQDKKIIKNQVTIMGEVKNSTEGEFIAATLALQDGFLVNDVTELILFTDCKSVVYFFESRMYALSYRKREEICREFRETVNVINEFGVKVSVRYVKGHGTSQYNKMVDRNAIEVLRKYKQNNQSCNTQPAT